ncbi:hypothetical protein [Sphingobium lactosutens]|uniref:Uncharacterized protein n=1 Tax=Sphingobium lactosutens DS20 TaxID=1331060 RepID=T0H3K9_9SPHN|nr:hypothetical protein [Sphingobium lactosutens]EQB10951.1 hypothetical protein RLDS_26305 [Sphingobium lactosutens DS20]
MMIPARLGHNAPIITQCGLGLFGLLFLYAMPPASGRMALVPVTSHGRAMLASLAIAHGARLVSAGPGQSLLVEGERSRLMEPLMLAGVLVLSARAGGCGGIA